MLFATVGYVTFIFGGCGGRALARAAEDNAAPRRSCSILHTRQPIPRQKRFRTKGGRGDGALRIGNLLIASKVPKASDSAQAQGRPRNRFTAAHFGSTFWVTKGGNLNIKYLRFFRTAQFAAAPCGGLQLAEARACPPPSANSKHQNRKCSPQDCAGRSLCPAEARYCSPMLTQRPPQAAARKLSH